VTPKLNFLPVCWCPHQQKLTDKKASVYLLSNACKSSFSLTLIAAKKCPKTIYEKQVNLIFYLASYKLALFIVTSYATLKLATAGDSRG